MNRQLTLQAGECSSYHRHLNLTPGQRATVVELLGSMPVRDLVSWAEFGLQTRTHSTDITDGISAVEALVGLLRGSDDGCDSVDLGFKKGYSLIEWMYSMQQYSGGHPLVRCSSNPQELTDALGDVVSASPFH